MPTGLDFFRRVACRCLTDLTKSESVEDGNLSSESAAASTQTFKTLSEQAPPMLGREYLDAPTLAGWCGLLADHVRDEAGRQGRSVTEYLATLHIAWWGVGRVTFHLAENKRSKELPFAFLATYADRLSADGKIQHLPLSRAARESAESGARDQLLAIFAPLERAASDLPWLKKIIECGGIYQPLAWTPEQAYGFLQSVETLQDAGIVVRTPDWWERKVRPKVTVKIEGSPSGSGDWLDFSASLTLDGEPLTEHQVEELLAAAEVTGRGNLVRFGGRWVELDRKRLDQAIAFWKRAEEKTGNVTFFEAMRWVSGLDTPAADDDAQPDPDWFGIEAGHRLRETLEKMRDPAASGLAEVPGLKATLRPYQEAGVTWLHFLASLKLGACLADDMGLGKTIQVLALLLRLKAEREPGTKPRPSLLVVPTSLMANWRAELDRFAPSLMAVTLHRSENAANLTSADTLDRAITGCDLAITTYGMVARLDGLRKLPWHMVILDEAQAIKNTDTKQSRAVKRLPADSRIALTGTPVENRLGDLWSLFDFLNPGLLGSAREFASFRKRLDGDDAMRYYAPLRRLVQPYILRRMKTDRRIIADLPDKAEVKVYCGLSQTQMALYRRSIKECETRLAESSDSQRGGVILAFITRFKQICNHPAQWHGSGVYDPADSGKFQRLATLCDELAQRQERVLVFTQYREVMDPLAEHLAGIFGRPGLMLHGGTAVKQRQTLVRDFQRDDGPPFFVLSLKAAGTGLNLTAASHVIHFDRWWNPAVENQATDRAYRIGQHRNVLVHKFVCRGTVEEKIDAMIDAKLTLSDAVLGGEESVRLNKMTDNELLEMVALDVTRAKIS